MSHHLPMFERPDLCGPCGGLCCKTIPGTTSPTDWGAPDEAVMVDRLTRAISSGRWALDWWNGEQWRIEESLRETVYFVRPVAKGYEGETTYPKDMGPVWARLTFTCTFLGPVGCELAHDARPLECRALEPMPDLYCQPRAGGKAERAIEWAPYQGVIAASLGRPLPR